MTRICCILTKKCKVFRVAAYLNNLEKYLGVARVNIKRNYVKEEPRVKDSGRNEVLT